MLVVSRAEKISSLCQLQKQASVIPSLINQDNMNTYAVFSYDYGEPRKIHALLC